MPRLALRADAIEFQTEPGTRLTAFRASVAATIPGLADPPSCFFDTGAPFSVVIYSVARHLRYTRLPVTNDPIPMFEAGKPPRTTPAAAFLIWDGIPCLLGEFNGVFRDTRTGATSQPLRWVAKVLTRPTTFYDDKFVLLGLQLLADNAGTFHVESQPWGVGGYLDLP